MLQPVRLLAAAGRLPALVLAMALAGASAVSGEAPARLATPAPIFAPPEVHVHPSPEARAESYLATYWTSHQTPAISVAVARGGRIVFSKGAGFADLDNMVPATGSTVYNIGSVSKVNAAVAVLQLVEAGKVRLDDPIRKYVPSFPEKGAVPITIQHILTHTSGIRHYRDTDFADTPDHENMKPIASLEEGIRIFRDDPLLFEPGKLYSYSSYAVNMLQGVVEKASGLSFEEYMTRFVWQPAGMLATQFDVPDRIVPHRARGYRLEKGHPRNSGYGDLTYKFAGGGMISTADDLVRLGVALLHGRLLRPETRARMFQPQVDPVMSFVPGKPAEKQTFRQGLIVQIRKDAAGRAEIVHTGSVRGFGACLLLFPDQDVVVAMLNNMNAEIGRKETEEIAAFFLDAPPG